MTTTLATALERKNKVSRDGRSIRTIFRLTDSGVENRYGEMEYIEFELGVSNYKERKRNIVSVSRQIAGPTVTSFELYGATAGCPFEGYSERVERHSRKALELLHAEALAKVELQLAELAEWARGARK